MAAEATARHLRESLAVLRIAGRIAHIGGWALDARTSQVHWSDEMFDIFEWPSRHQPTLAEAMAPYTPASRERVEAALHECLEHGTPFDVEAEVFTGLDRCIPVRATGDAEHDESGRLVRVIGTFQDLTEQQRTISELSNVSARLHIVLERMPDAFCLIDHRWTFSYVNAAAEAVLRRTREDLVGRPVWDEFPEAVTMGIRDRFERAVEDDRPVTFESYFTPFDAWIESNAYPSDAGLAVYFRDISERKRLEMQALHTQRMESIGALAGGMAHDLNNVLAPILLSIDVLRESASDPMARELLDTIQRSARRGADLVDQVLSFARSVEGERVPVSIARLVDDVRRLAAETFPKTISLRTKVAQDVWPVQGDRTQLHQVLMNFCLNARDAMPAGGLLTISAHNRILDDLYAQQHPDTRPGPYVLLEVDDTGTGMTESMREQLFEPTSLAIVRSHGGFISVYSEPDVGTVLKVHLPAEPTDATPLEAAAVPLPQGKGELVLLVDDEENVRTVARRTLEHHGYRVVTAANGAEAVALFASHLAESPVVITDMTMPVMDGPSAIVALRALDPGVRVVGSSGLGSDGDQARAVSASVKHFVPKPYTAERLLRTLRDVIDGPS